MGQDTLIMGKGMQPKKGYNQKLYEKNYDSIFRKKKMRTIKLLTKKIRDLSTRKPSKEVARRKRNR